MRSDEQYSEREYTITIPPNEGISLCFGYKDDRGEKALVIKDSRQMELASIAMDGTIDPGIITVVDAIKAIYRMAPLLEAIMPSHSATERLPTFEELKLKAH